jgi:hypothetical protein
MIWGWLAVIAATTNLVTTAVIDRRRHNVANWWILTSVGLLSGSLVLFALAWMAVIGGRGAS